MFEIKQKSQLRLISTKKTVEWLINNTEVSVFNPIEFTGYQRKIDESHCERLIEYLEKNEFFLPTAIICAISETYGEDKRLRIVDGQHRVHSFRMIRETKKELYEKIKDKELPVTVIENTSGDVKIEIDTFISINKTAKKVDTSLAYVLRNMLNSSRESHDLSIPKREYLSVELAYCLNTTQKGKIWDNLILFEGSVKNTQQTISLNSFVKSTRVLMANLEQHGVISTSWTEKDEIKQCINTMVDILNSTWNVIKDKWPMLFSKGIDDRRIIQGAIGYSSINRFLCACLKEETGCYDVETIKIKFSEWIKEINIEDDNWKAGTGNFTKFTSESGYTIVCNELLRSTGRIS